VPEPVTAVPRASSRSIAAAVAAPEPGESPGQPPTPQERLELLLDEAEQVHHACMGARLLQTPEMADSAQAEFAGMGSFTMR
jgi:hypothetical protein